MLWLQGIYFQLQEASIYNIVCIDLIVWRVLVWKVIAMLRFQLKLVNMPSKALCFPLLKPMLPITGPVNVGFDVAFSFEITLLPAIVTTTIQS